MPVITPAEKQKRRAKIGRSPTKRKAADRLLNDVSQRRETIRYPKFLSNHWQIGSGPTEARCKLTVGRSKAAAAAGIDPTQLPPLPRSTASNAAANGTRTFQLLALPLHHPARMFGHTPNGE